MQDLFLILGIIGMAIILIAFVLGQMHRLKQDDLLYDAMNAVGSSLLVAYAVNGRAWPFLILNAVWAVYSFKDVVRALSLRSRDPGSRSCR